MEAKPALRVVLNERLAGKLQGKRAHRERELDQHEITFGHRETMHVGRPIDGKLSHQFLRRIIAHAEQAVAALHAELDHVAVMALTHGVVMGMRRRDLTAQRRRIAEHAKRCERLRIEAHRERGLGKGNCLAAHIHDIDVAVGGKLG